MGVIKLLPDSVVNQIAAGEVVERPASVVRELIDNAIDAGADEVCVSILDGGRTLIKVSDNGCGMGREDALMAFERHATSKLSALSDLETIATRGFRGEALPSIASVSRVRLVTRPAGADAATVLEIAGGKISAVSSCASARGTEIEVRNLFFNVPARRKFLKSDRIEEMKIKDAVQNTALSRPGISFRLLMDDKQVFSARTSETREARARLLFKGNTVPVAQTYDEISISGLLGHPGAAAGDSRSLVILVNDRVVTDKLILRAVKEGFSTTLKDREFPVGFAAVSLPGCYVDVNVHPQKSEVRFSFPQKVFTAVRSAVSDAVLEFKAPSRPDYDRPIPRWNGDAEVSNTLGGINSEWAQPSVQADLFLEEGQAFEGRYRDLAYIGQLFACYLLCEHDGQFYIVDMHAAHERLNFNRIRERTLRRAQPVQTLLVPITVHVGDSGVQRLQAQRAVLSEFGFEVEAFGSDTVIVRAIPSMMQDGDIQAALVELSVLDEPDENPAALERRLEYIAARLACHASVRSGRVLKREEVNALFEQMDGAEFSAACPHGRPCVVKFGERDVERWFGRDR